MSSDDTPKIIVERDGPYIVRGPVPLVNKSPVVSEHGEPLTWIKGEMLRSGGNYALCRCGKSNRKPFCDDTHEDVKFDDSGPIGETGQSYEGEGGPLKVTCVPNGPLLLSGKFSMMTGSGRVAWHGTQAALCRCGTSKNMPFCDGSHVEADFKAE